MSRVWLIPVLLCAQAFGAISLGVHNHTDNGASVALTAVVNIGTPTAADAIICEVSFGQAGGPFVSVVDNVNAGNYSAAVPFHTNTSISQEYGIYYKENVSASPTTITLSWTANDSFGAISCQAWHGVATSSSLDAGMVQQQDLTATANPTTGGTLTPGSANELVIASLGTLTNTPTAGTNYTLIDSNSSTQVFPEYWIQTTATATNGPFAMASDTWTDQMAAFKAAGGAAPACNNSLDLLGVGCK